MIFFVPGYDPATEANLAIAVRIVGPHPALLREGANRESLLQLLGAAREPLFAMTHGSAEALLAHGGETALSVSDVAAIGQRSVFAFACHTATELGKIAAEAGAIWWGYTGAITSPDAPEALRAILEEIFSFLADTFADARSTEAQRSVLLQLRDRCGRAESRVDELLEGDPDLDAGPAYLCLLHLWDRLRIWEKGAGLPLHHPEARPPFLFPGS